MAEKICKTLEINVRKGTSESLDMVKMVCQDLVTNHDLLTHTHTHTDCVHVQLKRIVTTGSVKFRKVFAERFHLYLMAGVYSGCSAESSPVYGGDCLQIQ